PHSPASIPVYAECTLPGTTPQTPGTSPLSFAIAMMQVDVPTTLTTSPSLQPAPIASQCASNAPTGIGMPALRPISAAHFSESVPATESEARYSPPIFSRIPSSSGSTLDRNACGGSPPHFGFHIHLSFIAQILRFAFAASVTPVNVAATMSQCWSAGANP